MGSVVVVVGTLVGGSVVAVVGTVVVGSVVVVVDTVIVGSVVVVVVGTVVVGSVVVVVGTVVVGSVDVFGSGEDASFVSSAVVICLIGGELVSRCLAESTIRLSAVYMFKPSKISRKGSSLVILVIHSSSSSLLITVVFVNVSLSVSFPVDFKVVLDIV